MGEGQLGLTKDDTTMTAAEAKTKNGHFTGSDLESSCGDCWLSCQQASEETEFQVDRRVGVTVEPVLCVIQIDYTALSQRSASTCPLSVYLGFEVCEVIAVSDTKYQEIRTSLLLDELRSQ